MVGFGAESGGIGRNRGGIGGGIGWESGSFPPESVPDSAPTLAHPGPNFSMKANADFLCTLLYAGLVAIGFLNG